MALVILRKKRLLWVIFGLVGILYLVISVSRKLSNGDQTSIIHQQEGIPHQEARKSPSVASATHRKVIKKVPNIWARKKRPRVTRAPLNDKFQELAQQWKEKSFMGVDEYIYYSIGRLKLKPIKESVPLRPDFGPVVNDVTSFRYPINVQGCKSEQLVFIAVISAVKNFDKRQTIRQTWMQHLDGKVATVAFIVGLTSDLSIQQKLEEESAAHGDIIQIDSIDSFKFLTMKVVTLLNWLYRYCPSVPFALKCDDDVYVNVRNLLTVVRALPTKELSIYGRRHGNLDIQRDPTGIAHFCFLWDFSFLYFFTCAATWYVSYETWPWSSFPIFLSGGCVLISGKAISPLLAAAQTTPYLLTVDNVYLGGLLARKAGVPLRMSDEGIFSPGIRNMTDPCFFSGSVTWLTSSLDEMKDSHKATEDVLYRKKTRCFIHSEDGQTQKPDHVVEMFYKVADDYFVPFKGSV